jgi:hypothetical protein
VHPGRQAEERRGWAAPRRLAQARQSGKMTGLLAPVASEIARPRCPLMPRGASEDPRPALRAPGGPAAASGAGVISAAVSYARATPRRRTVARGSSRRGRRRPARRVRRRGRAAAVRSRGRGGFPDRDEALETLDWAGGLHADQASLTGKKQQEAALMAYRAGARWGLALVVAWHRPRGVRRAAVDSLRDSARRWENRRRPRVAGPSGA